MMTPPPLAARNIRHSVGPILGQIVLAGLTGEMRDLVGEASGGVADQAGDA
jgi:hypothetical protein